ncbi:DUF1203 domain-containing protein [Naumannella sp. ID2617S]|nr:DUF1203 domain-containing protein [Naumannella sp. ID2617S]
MDIQLLPIPADELDEIRRTGHDLHGHPIEVSEDRAPGRQLRCCLRKSEQGEQVALIGHGPLPTNCAWREVGPVFIHADECPIPFADEFPDWLDEGDRVLRAYDHNGAMRYERNVVVPPGGGVQDALRECLADPEVSEVHVRNLLAQCFITRAVRRTQPSSAGSSDNAIELMQ